MLFGFDLPLRGPLADAANRTKIATEAETMGFGRLLAVHWFA